MDFYSEMMSRNWAFISPEEQEKIRNTKILLAGCGLSSVIAVLAVETGFTKFIAVDHDVVEVSNLNRQAFDTRHLGQNKALALKSILEEKSEVVEVEAHPIKITPENAEEFVSKADVIVNTVDFDEAVYIVNEIAQKQGKISVFPINIGFGGIVLVFNSESLTLEKMLGEKIVNDGMKFLLALAKGLKNYQIPKYIQSHLEELLDSIKKKGYNPQLGVGAYVSSSLVIVVIVQAVLGVPIKVAPQPVTFDAWSIY